METKVKDNGQAKTNANTEKNHKTPQFVAGNPVNAESQKKAEAVKAQEQPKTETEKTEPQPQAEPSKKEIKTQLEQEKPALNLEQTLKKIKDLSRLSNQREKLITTIDELDAFEVKQLDDAEETNLNHFQRCELTITDDNGNTFSTKNPFIIDRVAKDIAALCQGKLAEVEAQISLTL
ncbi:hypothetical protein [Pedobacter deserti]|uniref:hypothetical protein n=1 Tax=Pedobacter deserti TaxID=2817382 RepID=UPI00210E0CE2|nr:hypothetical protein [Pedobacter sp. SYSU D00382]